MRKKVKENFDMNNTYSATRNFFKKEFEFEIYYQNTESAWKIGANRKQFFHIWVFFKKSEITKIETIMRI